MDVRVEIIRVEVKGLDSYELQCQVETKSAETVKKSATINESQTAWPKFTFPFKRICQSAVLLFSIIDLNPVDVEASTESLTDKSPNTIGNCLFPFTFSLPPNSKQLQHLASEVSVRAKQVQVAYLTSDIKGSDIAKVVGRVWFRVISPKVSKSKAKVTWFDLVDTIQNQLSPSKKQVLLSLPELLEKESELITSDTFPGSTQKVSILFHSVNTYLKTPSLTPIAKIGSQIISREKSFFDDRDGSKSLYILPILKFVQLVCEHREQHLELYLANNDLVIFSAAHLLQMLLPFKHYNWEYNWRWMAGTGGISPLHKSSGNDEPTLTASIMLSPPASQYSRFEGLEFLVYGVETDSSVQNIVLSVEFSDLASKSRSQTAASTLNTKVAPFMNTEENTITASRNSPDKTFTHETSLAVIKSSSSTEITPAYFFYPLHPFFRSNTKGVCLTLQFYAPDSKHERRLWWQASRVASMEIKIPHTLSSVLSSSENSSGVYWELNDSDIAQSKSESVAYKVFGVLRWKTTAMKFLTGDIGAQMHSLHRFNDLAPVNGVQPGLLTSILSKELREELDKESNSEHASDYKVAVKKMGVDILHLREHNKTLRRDNKRLEDHLLELENSVVLSSSDQAALNLLTKADLFHKILEQSKRLQTEIALRKSAQDKIKELQNSLIEKNEIEARFIELREAHSAQQKLVRDLQLKYEKYRRCSDICKQQEEVIVQLDSVIKHGAHSDQIKEAISVLSKENARLRKNLRQTQELSPSPQQSNRDLENTMSALRADLLKLRAKCADLETQLGESRRKQTTGLHAQTKAFEAKQKVKVAAARERTLLRELEENAKTWAQQKAQYEVHLAEYQAKLQILDEELLRYHHHGATTREQGSSRTYTNSQPQLSARASQLSRSPRGSPAQQPKERRQSHHPESLSARASQLSRSPRGSPAQKPKEHRQSHHPESQNSVRTQPQFDDSLDSKISF